MDDGPAHQQTADPADAGAKMGADMACVSGNGLIQTFHAQLKKNPAASNFYISLFVGLFLAVVSVVLTREFANSPPPPPPPVLSPKHENVAPPAPPVPNAAPVGRLPIVTIASASAVNADSEQAASEARRLLEPRLSEIRIFSGPGLRLSLVTEAHFDADNNVGHPTSVTIDVAGNWTGDPAKPTLHFRETDETAIAAARKVLHDVEQAVAAGG